VREIVPEAILPEDFPEERGWAADFDGESKADLVARCDRVAAWLTSTHPAGSGAITIVSHAQFCGYLIGRLFGIPGETLSQNRIRLSNCGVTRIDFALTHKVIHYSNATFHLGDVGLLEQQRGVG
jgi:broad specificity phosphatase PhoE